MAHHPRRNGDAKRQWARGREGAVGFGYVALIGAAVFVIAGCIALVPPEGGNTTSLLGSFATAVRSFTQDEGELLMDTFGGGRTLVFDTGEPKGSGTSGVRFGDTEAILADLPRCTFGSSSGVLNDRVLLSEIAWMGTVANAQNEWIELANASDGTADISGWQLVDRDDQVHVTFASGTALVPHGYLLMERREEAVPGTAADVLYGGSLRNSDEALRLFDVDCNTVDEVVASPSWLAGDNASKRTMERDLATLSWHTSAIPGGTPRAENSLSPKALGSVEGASTTVAGTAPTSVRRVATGTATSSASPGTVDGMDVPLCGQENLAAPTFSVLVNEVAWAGMGSTKTSDEWIELRNVGTGTVHLAGWQVMNKSRTLRVIFDGDDTLAPGGYYLIERTDDTTVPGTAADKLFSGAVKNNDEALRLFDERCVLVDEVVVGSAWPAGTASPDYRSAERSDDLSWHTYGYTAANGVFGTPRMQNSEPVPVPPTTAATTPTEGIGEQPSSPTAVATVRVLVSEVMAGSDGASSNEFIELYNAGDAAVVLTGWSLKKRASTGNESTLVAASRLEGKTVAPGGYLLLGNDTGYLGATPLDVRWPTSYTLAYTNNAVILFNATGAAHDEAVWAEVPAGKSYARASWESATFAVQEIPTPQGSGTP
jgi:hypothetical protein